MENMLPKLKVDTKNELLGHYSGKNGPVIKYCKSYDTWGNLISIKDENGTDVTNITTNVGYINPYRYRGYRYDSETGLYYLQSH